MRLIATRFVCFVVASSTAVADIEKVAIPDEKGFSLHWWPRLPAVEGWHHDRGVSPMVRKVSSI